MMDGWTYGCSTTCEGFKPEWGKNGLKLQYRAFWSQCHGNHGYY